MAEEIHEVRLLQQQMNQHKLDMERRKKAAEDQAKREMQEYVLLQRAREERKAREMQQALEERAAAERTAREYRAQETARETAQRRRRREYKAALDSQVNSKQANSSSQHHLSPAERSLNRRMLARMTAMDSTDTLSQWTGSQYSFAYGNNTVASSRASPSLAGERSPPPGSHVQESPGWREGGGPYGKSGVVTRREIMDLLDS